MPKYEVTVNTTIVEVYEIEAPSEDDAGVNYEEGERVTDPDVHKEVSEVRRVDLPCDKMPFNENDCVSCPNPCPDEREKRERKR